MKTKEVVIEGFFNIYNHPNKLAAHDLILYSIKEEALESASNNVKYKAIKGRLTLEFPAKEITITESELAEAWDKLDWVVKSNDSVSFKQFKKQLFGEE